MNIERDNLKKARELLNELETLESAIAVSSNYDSEIYAQFHTVHNNNEGHSKTVTIPIAKRGFIGDSTRNFIIDEVNLRIEKIKKELETM